MEQPYTLTMSVSSFFSLTNPGYGDVLTGTVNVAAGDMVILFGTQGSNRDWLSGSDDDGNTYAETSHPDDGQLAAYVATASTTNAALNVELELSARRTGKEGFCVVIAGGGNHISTSSTNNTSGTTHNMNEAHLSKNGVVILGAYLGGQTTVADGSTGWDSSDEGIGGMVTFRAYEERSSAKSGEAFTTSSTETSLILAIGIEYSAGGPSPTVGNTVRVANQLVDLNVGGMQL